MGIQIVVVAKDVEQIHATLGPAAQEAEVFPIAASTFGLSIPTKVIDAVGEQVLLDKIAAFEYFDLWAGVWRRPEAREAG